jgi:hypothetical protein
VLYISLARLPGFAKLYEKERESGSIGKNVFFSIQSADKISGKFCHAQVHDFLKENVPVNFLSVSSIKEI